jgi:hypothetical protein
VIVINLVYVYEYIVFQILDFAVHKDLAVQFVVRLPFIHI